MLDRISGKTPCTSIPNKLPEEEKESSLKQEEEVLIAKSQPLQSQDLAINPEPSVPLLVFFNAHRKIRKRMHTNVAFTREYSRVSISTRNAKCSSMNQGRLRVKIEKCFCG